MAQNNIKLSSVLLATIIVSLAYHSHFCECGGGNKKGGEIVMYNNNLVMTGTKSKPTIVIGEGHSSKGGGSHHEALKEHQHEVSSIQQETAVKTPLASQQQQSATKTARPMGFTSRLFKAFSGRPGKTSQYNYYQQPQMQQRVGKTSNSIQQQQQQGVSGSEDLSGVAPLKGQLPAQAVEMLPHAQTKGATAVKGQAPVFQQSATQQQLLERPDQKMPAKGAQQSFDAPSIKGPPTQSQLESPIKDQLPVDSAAAQQQVASEPLPVPQRQQQAPRSVKSPQQQMPVKQPENQSFKSPQPLKQRQPAFNQRQPLKHGKYF